MSPGMEQPLRLLPEAEGTEDKPGSAQPTAGCGPAGAEAPAGCDPVGRVVGLIRRSQAENACLLEAITVEESRLRGHTELRRSFFAWVKTATGYAKDYKRADKALNRFLISGDTDGFVREMVSSGVPEEDAPVTAGKVSTQLAKLRGLTYDTLPVSDTRDGPLEPDVDDDGSSPDITVAFSNRRTTVQVARPIWEKLRSRFMTFHALAFPDMPDSRRQQRFTEAVVWMRLKYSCLTGGRGGLQDCVPSEVMRVFGTIGTSCEMFSSPLNCCAPGTLREPQVFCSLLWECDCYFGSMGSAFDLAPAGGVIEVNPPFTEAICQQTHDHIDQALRAAPQALCFVIVVPDWADASGIIAFRANTQLVHEVVVPQGKHTYTDGLSGAPTPPFLRDTAVFLLANPAWVQGLEAGVSGSSAAALAAFEADLLATWQQVGVANRKRKTG